MRCPTPIQIDMQALPMVLSMMQFGIGADPDHFCQLDKEFSANMARLEYNAQQYAGGYINLNSHPQVSKLLYQILHLPKPKIKSAKAGKTMTGEDILAQIADQHPVIKTIMDHRQYSKLVSTYLRPMYMRHKESDGRWHPPHIRPDGRVYPEWRITKTDTGRLASASPNLMAQPVRSEEGGRIRQGYITQPGRVIVCIDFSGIEMRVLAWQSGDERMIGIFERGEDLHNQTAAWVFDIPIEQVDDKKHRYPSKRLGFGVVYGISATGLYRQMVVTPGCEDWTESRCQDALDKWFNVYPDVRRYMSNIASFAMRNGYVKDFTGRRRIVPGAQLKSPLLRARAIRQAGNAPIQMGAQSIMKMAMGKIQPLYEELRRRGYYVAPMAQVHDELVTECDIQVAHELIERQVEIMENVVDMPTGLKVDVEWSDKSWGQIKAYKGELK